MKSGITLRKLSASFVTFLGLILFAPTIAHAEESFHEKRAHEIMGDLKTANSKIGYYATRASSCVVMPLLGVLKYTVPLPFITLADDDSYKADGGLGDLQYFFYRTVGPMWSPVTDALTNGVYTIHYGLKVLATLGTSGFIPVLPKFKPRQVGKEMGDEMMERYRKIYVKSPSSACGEAVLILAEVRKIVLKLAAGKKGAFASLKAPSPLSGSGTSMKETALKEKILPGEPAPDFVKFRSGGPSHSVDANS